MTEVLDPNLTGQAAPRPRGSAEGPMAFEIDPQGEYAASRAALDAFQATLGQPQEGQDPFDGRLGSTYDGLIDPSRALTYDEVLRVNAGGRGRTEEDMIPSSEVAGALQQGEEHLRENAERWYRNRNYPGIPTEEGDLFDNDIKEAGQQAVDYHRAEVNAEVRRQRAKEADYKGRQERDQAFFDAERNDQWDAKVAALDNAFEYALRHEGEPGNMDDFNMYWGRLRAGEKKAYDAYREAIENPPATEPTEPDQPEPGTPPTPTTGGDQGSRRRRLRWPRRRGEPEAQEGDDGDQNPPRGRRAAAAGDQPRPRRNRAEREQRRHERADETVRYQRPEGANRREAARHWGATRWRQLGNTVLQMRGYGTQPEGEFMDDDPLFAERFLKPYGLQAPDRSQQVAEHARVRDQRDAEARRLIGRLYPRREDEDRDEYNAELDRLFNEDPNYWRTQTYEEDQIPVDFDLNAVVARTAQGLTGHPGEAVNRRRLINEIRSQNHVGALPAERVLETLIEQGILARGRGRNLIYQGAASEEE